MNASKDFLQARRKLLQQQRSGLKQKSKIPFECEKVFSDCYNGRYRFDFVAADLSFAIEVQGTQHFEYTPHFYKSYSEFTKAKERDRRKISYCLAHKIKLYIIPYWEIENLKKPADLFQSRFLAKDKFHNDTIWKQQNSKQK